MGVNPEHNRALREAGHQKKREAVLPEQAVNGGDVPGEPSVRANKFQPSKALKLCILLAGTAITLAWVGLLIWSGWRLMGV